eukprot:4461939-Amphidinium_carterae.1
MAVTPYPQDDVVMITEDLSVLPTDDVLTTQVSFTTSIIFTLHSSWIAAHNTFTLFGASRTQCIVT